MLREHLLWGENKGWRVRERDSNIYWANRQTIGTVGTVHTTMQAHRIPTLPTPLQPSLTHIGCYGVIQKMAGVYFACSAWKCLYPLDSDTRPYYIKVIYSAVIFQYFYIIQYRSYYRIFLYAFSLSILLNLILHNYFDNHIIQISLRVCLFALYILITTESIGFWPNLFLFNLPLEYEPNYQ